VDERKIYISDKHRRHSIRLKDYDYSQAGAYFVTICTKEQECRFGQIIDQSMQLSSFGHIVKACWGDLPRHYPHVELDIFVIMPNHIHGIIVLAGQQIVGAGFKPAPTVVNKRHGLTEVIRAFKTFSSRQINKLRGTPGTPIWQRNYYEHVIRNEDDLAEIREYIMNNLMKWELDKDNPKNIGQVRQT